MPFFSGNQVKSYQAQRRHQCSMVVADHFLGSGPTESKQKHPKASTVWKLISSPQQFSVAPAERLPLQASLAGRCLCWQVGAPGHDEAGTPFVKRIAAPHPCSEKSTEVLFSGALREGRILRVPGAKFWMTWVPCNRRLGPVMGAWLFSLVEHAGYG